MTTAVGVLNIVLGLVYMQYGTMTFIEMRRGWGTLGFSHFGAAWILMAFTCGPHHLIHGIHIAAEGRTGGALDFLAVRGGLPGRRDLVPSARRGVPRRPWRPLRARQPAVGDGAADAGGRLPDRAGRRAALRRATRHPEHLWVVRAEHPAVGIYIAIGYFLVRTQIRNRTPLGGWSVSGLALAIIFPTCALMHAVYAFYALTGRYGLDTHGLAIDWLAVPAGLYFLWVVRSLYLDTLADWNRETRTATRTPAVVG